MPQSQFETPSAPRGTRTTSHEPEDGEMREVEAIVMDAVFEEDFEPRNNQYKPTIRLLLQDVETEVVFQTVLDPRALLKHTEADLNTKEMVRFAQLLKAREAPLRLWCIPDETEITDAMIEKYAAKRAQKGASRASGVSVAPSSPGAKKTTGRAPRLPTLGDVDMETQREEETLPARPVFPRSRKPPRPEELPPPARTSRGRVQSHHGARREMQAVGR